MRRARSAGWSLLEVIVAAGILFTALAALVATVDASAAAVPDDDGERTATFAAAAKLEELRTMTPVQVCTSYKAGASPGATFDVPGLPGGGAGAGTITLHTNELESNTSLGLPRDLNGDGLVSSSDVSASVVLLPVEVTVRWRGLTGTRSITLATLLAKKG